MQLFSLVKGSKRVLFSPLKVFRMNGVEKKERTSVNILPFFAEDALFVLFQQIFIPNREKTIF